MPHIKPIVILDGKDVSRYFISCHSEQTANAQKDANKYDLVLANVGGYFFEAGSFAPKNYEQQTAEDSGDFTLAPKHTVSVEVEVTKTGCESGYNKITIFRGEIQKAEANELFLKIEGSCFQGGMTSRIHDEEPPATDQIYNKRLTITDVVKDLLTKFGIPEPWHIAPANNDLKDQNPYLGKAMDFESAFNEVAAWASSIYYFDENNEFWFTGVVPKTGFSNLTGVLLRSSNASTMVGYANHIDVYAGTIDDGDIPNERYTHWTQLAEAQAPDEDIRSYGLITAPPVFLEDGDPKMAQEMADNLLEWYRQYRDVPSIKVVNKAPGLMSKVAYSPWNGSMPPVSCIWDKQAGLGNVYGIVTRRVVDISAENGFTCTLDVTTNFAGMPRLDSEQEIWDYFSEGTDPEIDYVP
jgi:hypothetical protein